jgi:hypothetical protein
LLTSAGSIPVWSTSSFWFTTTLTETWFESSLSLMSRPTVSNPVCLGINHPPGGYDQIFNTVRQLRVWCGALSLTRGRVCCLQLLLTDPRQCSNFRVRVPCLGFETSLLVASYDSQGHGGGIRPRLHTGVSPDSVLMRTAAYISYRYPRKCLLSVRLHGNECWFHDMLVSKKLHFSFSYPWKRLTPCDGHLSRNVFVNSFPRNGPKYHNILIILQNLDLAFFFDHLKTGPAFTFREVQTLMILQFYKAGVSWLSEQLPASQEGSSQRLHDS